MSRKNSSTVVGWSSEATMKPIPPAAIAGARAPRRREERNRMSSHRTREKISELEDAPSFGVVLKGNERNIRKKIDEEESWTRMQIQQLFHFYFEDEVLYPRMQQLQDLIELKERRDIIKEEHTTREILLSTLMETTETLQNISLEIDKLVLLERNQRRTLKEAWVVLSHGNFSTHQLEMQTIETNAGLKIAKMQFVEQKRDAVMKVRVSLPRFQAAAAEITDFETRSRHILSTHEGNIRLSELEMLFASSTLRMKEAFNKIELLLVEEQTIRNPINHQGISLLGRVTDQEMSVRYATDEEQKRCRHRIQYLLVCCLCNMTDWIKREPQLFAIQRWWISILSKTTGRTATLTAIRQFSEEHRHKKWLQNQQNVVISERKRVTRMLRKAEREYATVHTAEAKLQAIAMYEESHRGNIVEDESWQRGELRAEFLFILIDEMIIPSKREMMDVLEPVDRKNIQHSEENIIHNILIQFNHHYRAIRVKESFIASEIHDRHHMEYDEIWNSYLVLHYSMRGEEMNALGTIRLYDSHFNDWQRRNVLLCELLLTTQSDETQSRSSIMSGYQLYVLEVNESLSRPGIWNRQLQQVPRLIEYQESPWRAYLMDIQIQCRLNVLQTMECSYRYRSDIHSDFLLSSLRQQFGEVIKSIREALNSLTPQIVQIQQFYKNIKSNKIGRKATIEWIRTHIRLLHDEQLAALQRKLIKEEIACRHNEIKQEEMALEQEMERRVASEFDDHFNGEAAIREQNLEEERWVWKTISSKLYFDLETTIFTELRMCREHEDYWRIRYIDDEVKYFITVTSNSKQSYLNCAVLPIQRCYRVWTAKKKTLSRISELLEMTSTTREENSRTEKFNEERIEFICIAESHQRELIECFYKGNIQRIYKTDESVCRLSEHQLEKNERIFHYDECSDSFFKAICCDESNSFTTSILDVLDKLMGCHGFSSTEDDARLIFYEDELTKFSLIVVEEEECLRSLLSTSVMKSIATNHLEYSVLSQYKTAIADHAEGLVLLLQEQETDVRNGIEIERTFHFRNLRYSSVEQQSRDHICGSELINFQLITMDDEESVRNIIDTNRLFGLRALYRIRLEAWQRTLLQQDRVRCVLLLLSEIEEAERELVKADYFRQLSFVKLLRTENNERIDNQFMYGNKFLRLCELQEDVHRRSVQQTLLRCQQSIVSNSQGSAFVVLDNSEDIGRDSIYVDEKKWRNRCVIAEESLRLHVTVLPIQRQWMIKLSWMHFKNSISEILKQANKDSRELLTEHTLSMFEYSELSHRHVVSTYEEKDFTSLKYEHSQSLRMLNARIGEQAERLAFEDYETEQRQATRNSEALSRIEVTYTSENQFRQIISNDCWAYFSHIISSSEEETRSRLEPDLESSLKSIHTIHVFEYSVLCLQSEESLERDSVETSETEDFQQVSEAITWMQRGPTEIIESESSIRNEIIALEFKSRECFLEVCHVYTLISLITFLLKINITTRSTMVD